MVYDILDEFYQAANVNSSNYVYQGCDISNVSRWDSAFKLSNFPDKPRYNANYDSTWSNNIQV